MTGLVESDTLVDFERPREGHAIYHRERARELSRTDKEAAKIELIKSIEIKPSRQAFNILFNLHLRSNDLVSAQQMMDQSILSDSNQLKLVPSLMEAAKKAGLTI